MQTSSERPRDRLPPLSEPDPVTIHDLTPEERENIVISSDGPAHARKWRWK
jgi:hypothetical protein